MDLPVWGLPKLTWLSSVSPALGDLQGPFQPNSAAIPSLSTPKPHRESSFIFLYLPSHWITPALNHGVSNERKMDLSTLGKTKSHSMGMPGLELLFVSSGATRGQSAAGAGTGHSCDISCHLESFCAWIIAAAAHICL